LKIIRGRSVRINLGNYEHIETNASVEDEITEEQMAAFSLDKESKAMNKILDELLEEDMRDAESSTSLDENSSFVFTWNEIRK
jgi:hypothetical protein